MLFGGSKSIGVIKKLQILPKGDHVSFSLDLHELDYPSKYELFFSVIASFVKNYHLCVLRDISNWARSNSTI